MSLLGQAFTALAKEAAKDTALAGAASVADKAVDGLKSLGDKITSFGDEQLEKALAKNPQNNKIIVRISVPNDQKFFDPLVNVAHYSVTDKSGNPLITVMEKRAHRFNSSFELYSISGDRIGDIKLKESSGLTGRAFHSVEFRGGLAFDITPAWWIDGVKPFENADTKKSSVAYTSSQLGWQYVDRLSLKEPGSEIRDQSGRVVCRINQVLGTLPKTYVLDYPNAADGLPSAMFVLVEGARVANEYRKQKHEAKHRHTGQ